MSAEHAAAPVRRAGTAVHDMPAGHTVFCQLVDHRHLRILNRPLARLDVRLQGPRKHQQLLDLQGTRGGAPSAARTLPPNGACRTALRLPQRGTLKQPAAGRGTTHGATASADGWTACLHGCTVRDRAPQSPDTEYSHGRRTRRRSLSLCVART